MNALSHLYDPHRWHMPDGHWDDGHKCTAASQNIAAAVQAQPDE